MKSEITREWILSGINGSNVLTRLINSMKVNADTGCWEVQKNLDRSGYGRIKINGRNLGSHKISYILHAGDYDQSKFEILHSCDNPRCINPDHLSHGTHKENMLDCIARGRFKGVNHHRDELNGAHGVIFHLESTRTMAIALGERTYHGSECDKHKTRIRLTSNGECACCRNEYNNKRRTTNTRVNASCPLLVVA